jgi:hypothetical protein
LVSSFCHSELHRARSGRVITIAKNILARATPVGARTLVYGASAGIETHGGYLPDCNLTQTGGLTAGEAGIELQKRVWDELKQKLDDIRSGVTSLV